MKKRKTSVPIAAGKVIDLYFLEHRAKLIDIAAFLDRIERAGGKASGGDYRLVAFKQAMKVVQDGKPQRAKRVLEVLSDPTSKPIPAAGTKGASGAWPGGPK